MLRHNCYHLKRVTNNDIHEGNKGTLRCAVKRAAPDPTTAGISCPQDCMGFHPLEVKEPTPLEKFKESFMSLFGK